MDMYTTGDRLEVIDEEDTETEQEPEPADEKNDGECGTAGRYGMWDKAGIDVELPTNEPYVLVAEKNGGPRGSCGEMVMMGLPDKKDTSPPVSTFQRLSVETNESLRFEPFVASDEEEPVQRTQQSGKTAYNDEVFETEPGPGGPGEGDTGDPAGGGPAEGDQRVADIYCTECMTSIQRPFGPHKNHRVVQIPKDSMEVKNDLCAKMRKLEEQIGQMENFAGHLEEIFITVEENFGRQEQNLEQHYNDVIQTLTQRYDERASGLENEKKVKLETLYSQLVDCGKTLDVSKELIEAAQEVYRNEDKLAFLQAVMPTIDRIEDFTKEDVELTLAANMEFGNSAVDLSDVKQMMESINIVPAPSAPVINPQVPNSAGSTSVRVCWSLFSDDTVEYYQLHYKPVLEDTTAEEPPPEESEVKVKETYRTVTDLLPNAQYEFWVTATNTTGISPPSEKAVYMTVPSPPVIKPRECASCPSAALIRWESGNTNPVDSYTVELSEAGEETSDAVTATEAIVAVPTCECLVQLQPGRQYCISVRAVNIGGPSERSQPVTVHTTGTYFHLLEDTAHPCLSISEDGFTMFYGDDDIALSDMIFTDNTFAQCVAVLGELIPVRGTHYWEVEVEDCTEFRIGVAYQDTQRNGYLGGNNTSWCMRHVVTPSRHKFEFLHNGWSPDIRITINPRRIGVRLDYDTGKLSFFNAALSQHLYTFDCHFLHYVHPCFALDHPGALTVHNGIEPPGCVRYA
ncbi:fibronectin type III and SPRY domain-containing protein 2 [Conger conger]|uniref:fibronectin type III and SPRY domain-containing protein 2 n=1 Tax=Conger conger TaxID=82655 RepID=UPI002A59F4C0|nr:fibronectin type III and SPRY domain-containing protein 2 [Conger conger]XP_061077086.1 fibronectin type III and SPRY domain-containing protein 2 [Conger conger]XP_061077087.1 fibronectin type III and SPRY domain-containing protein 2 [Conger conger]